jgi:hypothetical protein
MGTPDYHKKQNAGKKYTASSPRTTDRNICSHQHPPSISTTPTTNAPTATAATTAFSSDPKIS